MENNTVIHCSILLHKGTEQQQNKTKAYPYHTQQVHLKQSFYFDWRELIFAVFYFVGFFFCGN